MRAFVTGGTGFIGGALVRHLLEGGHQVRALVRPGADTRQLDGLPVELVEGDLADAESLQQGIAGCDWVFHVAALYSYWGHAAEDFYQTNVEGTRHVLEAARRGGVARVVYTSSIAALGVHADRTPATENTPSSLEDRIGAYQRSKFLAQQAAEEYAGQGLPVVIVNPSTPVGVGDHKPTPTGQIIVDYLNGGSFHSSTKVLQPNPFNLYVAALVKPMLQAIINSARVSPSMRMILLSFICTYWREAFLKLGSRKRRHALHTFLVGQSQTPDFCAADGALPLLGPDFERHGRIRA